MSPRHAACKGLPAVKSAPNLELVYTLPEQDKLPHIVKFSGGRSSAMMLLGLLYSRQLKPSRGDVVVFNNTSTESPATYRFVRLIQRITEGRFNIPFFWTEFTTYEDASRGEWRRIAGYRLVKPRPYASNMPKGYRRHGEVFEELVSWKQQLPNRFTRICTEFLKLQTTALFIADWLGRSGNQDDGPRRLGHWHNGSRINPEHYGDRSRIVAYHIEESEVVRDAQRFQDYTKAVLTQRVNPVLRGRVFDRRAELRGENAAPFVSVVGLRADEPRRVGRVLDRNAAVSTADRFADGELVTVPLFDAGIGKNDIREFWEIQKFDLELPYDLNQSNCVFCFLKGERELRRLAQNVKPKKETNGKIAPDNVMWWRELERRYARKVPSVDDPNQSTTFGFFGKNRLFYDDLITGKAENIAVKDEALPCDCTD